jgi:S1-C subfamily serine protease
LSRFFILASLLPLFPYSARADDTIAAETIELVKKATVFVRVEGDGWSGSGSGFVISADDKSVLIATNRHVAAPTVPDARPNPKPATISVVFDSGSKTERSYTCTIEGTDSERDLAVLRATGVKDAPRPIAHSEQVKLFETMPVYTFGFPFGKALATNKGSPAVTVGKASISSLRNGPDGELSVVQIDGNLNPGNSGGPVVDVKGRLVGVAVATIRDGQGIGLTIPAAELEKMLQGRFGRVRIIPKKAMDGATTVRIEVDLIDPLKKLRTANAYYVVVAPKTKRTDGEALDKHAGSKKLELKIEKGVGTGEFTLPKADGEVLIQVLAAPDGNASIASKIRSLSLSAAKLADFTGMPPSGWKEYTSKDKAFIIWVPEKPDRQADLDRNILLRAQRMRMITVVGKTTSGLLYEAQSIVLPASFVKAPKKDIYDMFKNAVVDATRGKVTDTKDIEIGSLSGTEYQIEAETTSTRLRMSVAGARVYLVQVTGEADLVIGTEAETILSSYRLPGAVAPAKGQSDLPTILGGGNDAEFKDSAPEGGLLIGFEIGLGKFFNRDMIRAVKPIYRVGDKETFGEQHGTQVKNLVAIKAKTGYAVGAISVKHGLGFDGMSITFMKVVDGKLDPKDSYESEFVGSDENKPTTKLGGSGTPVIGIVGKSNNKDMTGMGLLFKVQDGKEPKKP